MASIKFDQTVDGLRTDLRASATHLLPYDPVHKKRYYHAGDKRVTAIISDTTGAEATVWNPGRVQEERARNGKS
jgi:hypothetical protein